MSIPITVVKENKKSHAPLLRLFIRIVAHSTWTHCLCLANHRAATQTCGPGN